MKKMNKFERKSFECEMLSMLYTNLEDRKTWYMRYNSETDSYIQSDEMHDIERCAIIETLMEKIEKMV